ncbi:hypothetical protein CYK37_23440 [Mesorhizobium loti]|nr:hypothetical protein [Mesorhizobium loti]PLP56769.1 hypothetical protein CYK37_23440 [Mesorhizobium loti]
MRSALTILVLAGFCQGVSAGEITSVYTDLVAEKDCLTYAKAGDGDGDWADLSCSGYRGYPVLLGYDDARESVFYGFPPTDMTSSWESFVGFNSAGPKVEWRVETNGDVSVPFAAINRRSVSGDDGTTKTEVLVVAKVAQMESRQGCTVALVAGSSPNANDEARKIADEKARSFACGKDTRITVGTVPAFGRVDN